MIVCNSRQGGRRWTVSEEQKNDLRAEEEEVEKEKEVGLAVKIR